MKIWYFLQPATQKLVAFGLPVLLWIVPTSREAVMKGAWDQLHGFPFTFIFLTESTVGGIYRIWISRFYAATLLVDVTALYLMSCVIYLVTRRHHA